MRYVTRQEKAHLVDFKEIDHRTAMELGVKPSRHQRRAAFAQAKKLAKKDWRRAKYAKE